MVLNNLHQIKVLAFDADDTLWDNQSYYDNAEKTFCEVLSEYMTADRASEALFRTECANMPSLGYGAKAFTISLLQTALEISGEAIDGKAIAKILNAGKSVFGMPCTPLPGVEETLARIHADGRYRMVLFTKGDLLDQQNKISKSGLGKYFSHIEITSKKTTKEYIELCRKMDITENELLMVGNSFKSDIEPVLMIGGCGIHIPFEHTWQHEKTDEYEHDNLVRITSFSELLKLLN